MEGSEEFKESMFKTKKSPTEEPHKSSPKSGINTPYNKEMGGLQSIDHLEFDKNKPVNKSISCEKCNIAFD